MTKTLPPLIAILLLAGCAAPPRLPDVPSPSRPEALKEGTAPPPVDVEAQKRLALADRLPKPAAAVPLPERKLYAFSARALPVRLAMEQFGRAHNLNVAVDADVEATVSAEFRNLPFDKALEALLETNGLSWDWDGSLLRVSRLITRTFTLDYLRLTRTGSASSTTNTSSGGASQDSARIGVTRNDSINFWAEVENQIEAILTKSPDEYPVNEPPRQQTTVTLDRVTNTQTTATQPVPEKIGRLVVNRLSGTIQVVTSNKRMRAIEAYLETLKRKTMRQVYIDVRVVEVTLSANKSFGIDWTRVGMGALTLTAATGATGIAAPTLGMAYSKVFPRSFLVKNVDALLNALQEQGNVRVVSQPRIRTLNNQPAVVKSGTERTFFATTTTVVPQASGAALVTTTNTPTTVTEGIVLGVTPQIGDDDRITLDVSPAITRISGVDTSPDGNSNAPRLDIKQATTLVRVGDGESAVIGGLIEEVDSATDRGVPELSQAEGIGRLFGTKQNGRYRRELVIVLTPYVVD